MTNPYDGLQPNATTPGSWSGTVTASEEPLPRVLKAVRATGEGTIWVKTVNNDVPEDHDMLNGEWLELLITHVTIIPGSITKLKGIAD